MDNLPRPTYLITPTGDILDTKLLHWLYVDVSAVDMVGWVVVGRSWFNHHMRVELTEPDTRENAEVELRRIASKLGAKPL